MYTNYVFVFVIIRFDFNYALYIYDRYLNMIYCSTSNDSIRFEDSIRFHDAVQFDDFIQFVAQDVAQFQNATRLDQRIELNRIAEWN